MVELALALGIAINLICTELFGLASGGLIVPGYLALHANQPTRLVATLAVAMVTWAVVRYGWMRMAILYGRRRFGITVLTGFVFHGLASSAIGLAGPMTADLRVVGYLVPGLIAHSALSQGLWPTLGMTLGITVIVRLLLGLCAGWIG
ncbi:MAG: poly-gamma-glutamate biosynthesis protein PgsC [Acidobacteriota bacterium]